MISIESDPSGRTYQVWKQNQLNSCGIACAWMARGIARRMSFSEEEWGLAVRTFGTAVGDARAPMGFAASSAPMSFSPRAFSHDQGSMASAVSRFGFYGDQIANVMRGEGLRVDHAPFTGHAHRIVAHKIAIDRPAIALVSWNTDGGHFIVIGRATPHAITVLDPWDGHINQQYNNGAYSAPYGNQGWISEVLYISA